MYVDTYRCSLCLAEIEFVTGATVLRGRFNRIETNDNIMKGSRES